MMNSRVSRIIVGCALATVTATGIGLRYAGTALVVARPIQQPDAIISLASHEWERLPATARVAALSPSAVILLTLPQSVNAYNCHDCSRRVTRLQRLGVAPGRVRVIPITSPGTYGEAVAALGFARQARVRRLLIVTTPYHTRRSLAAFRSVFDGSAVQIGIVPATASSPARPDRWWATPYDRAYVAYEWAAAGYYLFRYRVLAWA